jgi:hypothetical protein
MHSASTPKPLTLASPALPVSRIVSSSTAAQVPRQTQHALDPSRLPHHSKCAEYLRGPIPSHLEGDSTQIPATKPNRLHAAQRAVVLVKVAAGWGSGVVVDCHLGLVLTNAHLFEQRTLQKLPTSTSASNAHGSSQGEDAAAQGNTQRTEAIPADRVLSMRGTRSTMYSGQYSSTDATPIPTRKEYCQVWSRSTHSACFSSGCGARVEQWHELSDCVNCSGVHETCAHHQGYHAGSVGTSLH